MVGNMDGGTTRGVGALPASVVVGG